MATEDSLQQSMGKAVKRYPSLFRLPSTRKVVLLLPLICVGGGLVSTVILFHSVQAFFIGLAFGMALFLISLVFDYASKTLILRDAILDFRRTVAVSLFCWGLWFLFVFMGVGLAALFGLQWWVRLSLLGFSAVMIFRLIVFNSTTSMSQARIVTISFLEPFSCVVPFLLLWYEVGYSFTVLTPWFFLLSPVIAFGAAYSFIYLLNSLGKEMLGLRSLSIFKAFMQDWVMGLNAPLEEILEKLGEKRDVEISWIKFGSSKPTAVVVVPSVHPGPFKNIGSSLLPSLLKADLEKSFGCIACVPHGLFGHEFDLASQTQTRKLIDDVVSSLSHVGATEDKASPFVKVSNGLSTACCQVFGKSAFISFTLAPRTIEDLPQELGQFVRQEAEKRGLNLSAVVNAHNSINGTAHMQEALISLKDVAVKCLEKAISRQQSRFEIGVATVLPKDFSLADGMGSGGITVIIVKTNGTKAAYVVIDGNNMVSGLREEILSSLNSIGIDDGEVFTTDTHSVSALVLNGLGYNPVGQVMNNSRLIDYVKQTTLEALNHLESAKAECCSIVVSDVKVIGAQRLETLCALVERGIQRARRTLIPILAVSGLLLMLLLWFI